MTRAREVTDSPSSPRALRQAKARATVSLRARLLNHPTGRIALAIALSLLAHAVLVFGPNLIKLAPLETPLPPLMAKLEPLPAIKPAVKPVAKPHKAKKPKPHPLPKPALPPEPNLPAEPAASVTESALPVAETPTPVAEKPAEPVPVAAPAHPLPKHAQMTFLAYKGTRFQIGEARHRLEIGDDHSYTLQVGINTTGLASLFKTFEMNQQSRGTVGAQGLQPDEFSENRLTAKGKQELTAHFDWTNKQLEFSSGNHTPLPEQTQDMLSFLYQFSQMPLDQATLDMHVSNGRKLESYQFETGAAEDIQTRLGKLHVLPLRKIHAPGEEGLEIWLGLEYRLLPVKVRQIDRNGEIAGELVISEIRVSEY